MSCVLIGCEEGVAEEEGVEDPDWGIDFAVLACAELDEGKGERAEAGAGMMRK